MTKEFIPYEQAVELKELGFDKGEECLAYYNTNPRSKTPAFDLTKPLNHEYCLPAPLYQQAFKWFREKYKLESLIRLVSFKNPLGYTFEINLSVEDNWGTYEEAELACLKKLIEIAKNK